MWDINQADDEIVIAFKLAGFYQLTIPAVKPGGYDIMIQLRDKYNQSSGSLKSHIKIHKAGIDVTESFIKGNKNIRPTANNLCYILNLIQRKEKKGK